MGRITMKRFGVMRMLMVAAAFVCEFSSFESYNRRNVIVDLSNRVDAAQSHGGEHFLAEDVERLGDAGLRQAIGLDAADHAGSGAQRQRVHHVLAEAEPRHPLI
jgi:hypothetical protein